MALEWTCTVPRKSTAKGGPKYWYLFVFVGKLLSPEGVAVASNAAAVLDMDCENVDESFQHDSVTEDNDYIISTNESQVRKV